MCVSVNIEESGPPKKRKNDIPVEKKKGSASASAGPVKATSSKEGEEKAGGKATDDYHYERFKKQFRRY